MLNWTHLTEKVWIEIAKRIAAFWCVLLLLGIWPSFGVYARRVYDTQTTDFAAFSAASHTDGDVRSVVLLRCDRRPDFRSVHPQYTAQGPDGSYLVRFADAQQAQENLAALQKMPGVRYAECNDYVTVQKVSTRTAEKGRSWGIRYMRADVMADWIHNNALQTSALVAVVDSGITASHALFRGRIRSGVSYLKTAYTCDESGHGTAVAGIIADVTQGLNVQLLIVKAINAKNGGTLVDVTSGIKYAADQGADVVNISFVSEQCHPSLHDAIRYAMDRGCLPVISAGNYGTDMDKQVCCPAHLQAPTVVTACTNTGMLYTKNCYGSSIDLCAPGSNVVTASNTGKYIRATGTSFAAPHVAAAAALYKLCYPDADVDRLQELLVSNTRDHGRIGYDKKYGWGTPALNKSDILSTGVSATAHFTFAQWVEYILFFDWVRYV